jgi:hypothetical protein
MKRTLITCAALVLSLSGCAADASSSSSTAPTKTAPPATFDTVLELRDAFVAAGGDCEEWQQGDRVTLAAQSGDCDTNTVLSVYLSESSRDQVITNLKSMTAVHLIVGENWIINTPAADDDYSADLGGTIVTSPAP